ncbi:hypothetical protein D3C72_327650 [compost metagenome]
MPGYVIDSNMLQSDELRRYLGRGREHLAVLPDFVWYELYKQESMEGLRLGLSVLGDYPDQVILLQPAGYISRLNPAVAGEVERLIMNDSPGDITELVRVVRSEGPVDETAAAQLRIYWSWARTLRPSLIEGASDIAQSYPEMQEQMFDEKQIRIIRTNGKYSEEMFATIFGAAFQLWETFAAEHQIEWEGLDEAVVSRAYLFRFSLGLIINLLWWIRGGSQPVVRMDRLSNDMIDLSFAVYATYFDGFFTRDVKAGWVHANLIAAIAGFADCENV